MKITKVMCASVSMTLFGLASIGCTTTQYSSIKTGRHQNQNNCEEVKLHTIYFDFDRYNVRPDQEGKANEMADSLACNNDVKVQIQGHTDDRGSVEYNMALGSRRAESLKDYLVAHGVEPDNIDTVSYGKERPAAEGENDEAWAKNRRDDVVFSSK